jgi:hypothetical protein
MFEMRNTISSIAAFEGAQMSMRFTSAVTSMEIIPWIVCVLPVPG